jgi:uncharacterized protein (DUF983 family)
MPVMVQTPVTPRFSTLLGRACRLHCPVCGSGHLFRHWTKIVQRCPRCGYPFERIEGQFIGAVGMNTILTFGALLITLVIGLVLTAPDVRVAPILIVSVSIALLMPIFLYPYSKTIWTAIDLRMRPLEPGETPGLDDAT